MSTLPKKWAECKLAEIVDFNVKPLQEFDDGDLVSFVPMAAVNEFTGQISDPQTRTYAQVKKGFTNFQNGDVIFAKITPCMENGKAAVVSDMLNGIGWGSTEFHVLTPRPGISEKLIWLYLRQTAFRRAAEGAMTGAVGQRRVPTSYLKDHDFPLAPLPEQKRIVVKIDSLSTKSGRAKAHLDHIPRLVEKYKQAILAAAFRGDLTREWRSKEQDQITKDDLSRIRHSAFQMAKEKGVISGKYVVADTIDWQPSFGVPVSWIWASIDEVSYLLQYGSSAKTNDDDTGIPVLRMGNIQDGKIDTSKLKYLPPNHSEFPGLFLDTGDVIFNRTNSAELVGKTAVYSDIPPKASFASYLIRLKACGLLPELVSFYINSPFGRDWVASVVNQQVGQANVNGTKLRQLGVPVPPIKEQVRILELIKSAFKWIDRLANETENSSKLLDKLDQAVLAKAFRGELVPQDPNDEPAEKLLERIRAERAVAPKAKRGRKS